MTSAAVTMCRHVRHVITLCSNGRYQCSDSELNDLGEDLATWVTRLINMSVRFALGLQSMWWEFHLDSCCHSTAAGCPCSAQSGTTDEAL